LRKYFALLGILAIITTAWIVAARVCVVHYCAKYGIQSARVDWVPSGFAFTDNINNYRRYMYLIFNIQSGIVDGRNQIGGVAWCSFIPTVDVQLDE
jgi:hypothetical protein